MTQVSNQKVNKDVLRFSVSFEIQDDDAQAAWA
jgi:hypothetical protein